MIRTACFRDLFISRESNTVCKEPGYSVFIIPVSSENGRAFQTLQAHLLCCCRVWRCYCMILAPLGNSALELSCPGCPIRGCAITLHNLPTCHGSASDLTFLKCSGKHRPLPSRAPCNHTQPQQTSEHQLHTQNMAQATRYQRTQGLQAESWSQAAKTTALQCPSRINTKKILDTGVFCSFVTGAPPLTSSSYALSPVTQPGLAQSLQAFYQLAPPKLGVREEMQQ